MMKLKVVCACCVSLSTLALAAQSAGPDARQITDPRTLTSESSPTARPIPIDDLYFTRSLGGASWSPDGKEILFTTDISGRMNLWKVSASGGWPRAALAVGRAAIQRHLVARRQVDRVSAGHRRQRALGHFRHSTRRRRGGQPDRHARRPRGSAALVARWEDDRHQSKAQGVDGLRHRVARLGDAQDHAADARERRQNHLWQIGRLESRRPHAVCEPPRGELPGCRGVCDRRRDGKATNLTPHQGQTLYIASSLSPDGKTLLRHVQCEGRLPERRAVDISRSSR